MGSGGDKKTGKHFLTVAAFQNYRVQTEFDMFRCGREVEGKRKRSPVPLQHGPTHTDATSESWVRS